MVFFFLRVFTFFFEIGLLLIFWVTVLDLLEVECLVKVVRLEFVLVSFFSFVRLRKEGSLFIFLYIVFGYLVLGGTL